MRNLNYYSVYLIYKCNAKTFWIFCQGMNLCATRCFVKTFRLLVMFKFGYCFLLCVCECVFGCVSACISWNFLSYRQVSVHKTPICPFDFTFLKIQLLLLLICSLILMNTFMWHFYFHIWQVKISSPSIFFFICAGWAENALIASGELWMESLWHNERVGAVQGACASMLPLLISAKRCGPIFTAL